MGNMLKASCRCGFKEEFLAGGGMQNFQTFCGAPAFCTQCQKFVLLNYLAEDTSCPDCGAEVTFYNDPSLQQAPKKAHGTIFTWNTQKGEFILPDTSYRCPSCGKFDLHFQNAGNWD